MGNPPLYYSLRSHYKKKFGVPPYKISLDAGFTCPNRTGNKGTGGCAFCNPRAFLAPTADRTRPLPEQIQNAMEPHLKRDPKSTFILYFQAYTNSYGSYETLEAIYKPAIHFPGVCGLIIGTRPDCISDDFLHLVAELQVELPVWVELGIQTIWDPILEEINRGHTQHDSEQAVNKINAVGGIQWVAHLIQGLPGETLPMMVESVRWCVQNQVSGIKFHQLHIVKDTPFEQAYHDNRIQLLDETQVYEILGQSLLVMPSSVVVYRLFSDSSDTLLVAPQSLPPKNKRIESFRTFLVERGWYQGKEVGSS